MQRTPLAAALAAVDSHRGRVDVDRVDRAPRRTAPRRSRGCPSRSRSRARAASRRVGRAAAIQRRHMRVVGWVPVPKARPGSSRITCARLRRRLVPGRHDPELGRDLDRRELRLRQPHPVLLGDRRDRRCTLAAGDEVLRQQQRAPPRVAAASSANRALTRERCQPALGGGMPGSPNSALLGSRAGVGVLDRDATARRARRSARRETASTRSSRRRSSVSSIIGRRRRSALVLIAASLRGSGCWCRPR